MNRELEANIFMDWMFNSEEKIKPFNRIMQQMKEVYLADSKPWVLAVSFGKDSSLTLYLA